MNQVIRAQNKLWPAWINILESKGSDWSNPQVMGQCVRLLTPEVATLNQISLARQVRFHA